MSAPSWAIRAYETMQFKRLGNGQVKLRRIHKIFRPLLENKNIGFHDEITISSDEHEQFKKNCHIVACGIEPYLEEENEILSMIQSDLFGDRVQLSQDLTGYTGSGYFGVQFDGDYDSKLQP
jgi:hypothetical protein